MNDREMNNYKDMYILKPTSSSCGRGIRVIGKKDTVNKRHGYLVSKYLSNPHLLRGYKYDLRIYIIVTSFEPMKAYFFQDGLVRLATQQYSTAKGNLKKRYVHLTNYSVNKKADTYVKNKGEKQTPEQVEAAKAEEAKEEMEFKWSLKQLKEEWEKMGISYADIFAKIKDLCVKTLMSVEPVICSSSRNVKHRNQCYEIYGFDVLIDNNLRPWLLEVNVLPSLSSSSPFDKHVKSMLLSDTMHLIGFTIFDRRKIEEERRCEKNKKGIRSYVSQREESQIVSGGSDQKAKSPYGEMISPTKKLASPSKKSD
jgi:tubulin polyglutamylase TTLL4